MPEDRDNFYADSEGCRIEGATRCQIVYYVYERRAREVVSDGYTISSDGLANQCLAAGNRVPQTEIWSEEAPCVPVYWS